MTTDKLFLDQARIDKEIDFAACLKLANEKFGKSYFAAVKEIYGLSKGVGNLEPHEYLYYQLYNDERFSWEDKTAFFGKQASQELDINFLKNAWTHITADKLVVSGLLAGYGLPVPNTFAVYHRFRECGDARALHDAEAVAAFLRDGATYPFFSKPASSTNSLAVASVESYDPASDSLRLADGRQVGVEAFVEAIAGCVNGGYCFQERLTLHPKLAELCGGRMSSFRVFLLQDSDGPEILRASWKISVGDNPADNFWREGNLLAAVDPETGRVTRVVRGAGPDLVEVETHPDSGARLQDAELPLWAEVRDCCLRGAKALPNCHVQGWDVAITDRGPVLIELEGDGGHPQMVQLAQGQGLYQGRFKEFYDKQLAAAEGDSKSARKKRRAAAAKLKNEAA